MTHERQSFRIPNAWYVACASSSLKRRPLSAEVLGIPFALFRDAEGKAAALLDRCPHRNVPLSEGRCVRGEIECAYHGWKFDSDGRCVSIPGLENPGEAKARSATAFAVVEQDGYVWIWPSLEHAPEGLPHRFPHLNDAGFSTVRRELLAQASMFSVLENTLDVPHTAFLHRGLFRGGKRASTLEVAVRHRPDGIEAEYFGEARPSGLLGLVAPKGETLVHVDRFLRPNVAQVEYRLGHHAVIVTSVHTPISDSLTRVFVVATFKLPVPHLLVVPVLSTVSNKIWKQDARILSLQRENVARFGGEQFASTVLDALGPRIVRQLREMQRGEACTQEPEIRFQLVL